MKFHECRLVRMFKRGQTNDLDATIQLHNPTASEITMKVSASETMTHIIFLGWGVKLWICEIHHEL
jgi:hypothetical protein